MFGMSLKMAENDPSPGKGCHRASRDSRCVVIVYEGVVDADHLQRQHSK